MSLLMQSTEIRFWNWLVPIAPTKRHKIIDHTSKSAALDKVKSIIDFSVNLKEQANKASSIPVQRDFIVTTNNALINYPTAASIPNTISIHRTLSEVINKPLENANAAKRFINPQIFMILSSSSLGFIIGLMISIFI